MHQPLSLSEIKTKIRGTRNINESHKEQLSALEKLAVWITRHVGTMGFFFIIFLWTLSWLSWNTFGPIESRFDPFPSFVLWLFISNMIQIFLMPLMIIGQNLQSRHAKARAKADFEINLKSEQEIETILQHLENQNELIIKILNKLESKNS